MRATDAENAFLPRGWRWCEVSPRRYQIIPALERNDPELSKAPFGWTDAERTVDLDDLDRRARELDARLDAALVLR